MNIRKRGDHLFAAGLAKTIRDLAELIRVEIGDCSEGSILKAELSERWPELTSTEFHTVINKGGFVTGDDAHSHAFGRAARDLKWQMQSLAFALNFRRGLDDRDPAARVAALRLANAQVTTAKYQAMLALFQFFDAVVDENVMSQLVHTERNDSARLARIAATRTMLERVRLAIAACIARV